MRSKDYIIEFNKLRMGPNEFTFVIDDRFLAGIEGEHPQHANVKVHLVMIKTETMYDLKFDLAGTATLTCDVCLDDFEMPLKGHFSLIMKISEVENYSDDEIIYISPNLLEYDLTQYLYDSFMVSLPIRKVCSMGGKDCNPEVLKKLEEMKADEAGEVKDDRQGPKDDDDPRWDKLKELFNNN